MIKYSNLLILFALLYCHSTIGQHNYWTLIDNTSTQKQWSKTTQTPTKARTPQNSQSYQLDEQKIRSLLKNVPQREVYGAKRAAKFIDFPTPNGTINAYRIEILQTLSNGLAEQYPELKTYRGTAIKNPMNTIRIAMNKQGIHVVFFDHLNGIYSLDQILNTNEYVLHKKEKAPKLQSEQFSCKTTKNSFAAKLAQNTAKRNVDDGTLRTFRMAIATTGEYSQFHINRAGLSAGTDAEKKEAVLSAVMTTMMTINALFENEFSISMQLIPNMDRIIFLDAQTDGLENGEASILINDSQAIIDANIGLSNYDIGHTFSTGAGGLAQIGSPCSGGRAQGVTGISAPVGAEFDLDFVAHEIGHQFGANHVQNNDDERVSLTAVEPGSGSTIMGYAGISPPNIQRDSDPYFNVTSIREIWNFIENLDSFGNCGVTETSTNNTAPIITSDTKNSYTIPHSTPFALDATATDADNDALTYCWEQQDPEVGIMPPVADAIEGPMFRSLPPTEVSTRYFPPYAQILAGELKTEWQVVPTVARELNFTLTVRDNNPVGGQNAQKDVKVNVASTGPFRIISQNNPTIAYNRNEIVTIEWDVAGTTNNGINTERVNILLSYDGGQTFTESLINNTNNDGRERIVIPKTDFSTTCRIKIVPTNNIYFAINTQNFTIKETIATDVDPTGTIMITPSARGASVFNIDFGKKITPAKTITVDVFDLAGRLVFTKTYSDTFDASLDMSGNAFGLYIIRIIRDNEIITKKVYSKTL